MRLEACRIGLLALGGLLLALSAGSCGKVVTPQPLFDSNTNWLVPCMLDEQCSGSLRCYCGQCTKPCAQDTECSLLQNAQCAQSSAVLCGESASAGGLCVRGCREDAECGSEFSCSAGQCVPDPCSGGQCATSACETSLQRSWDDVLQFVSADINLLDLDDQPFTRYFTLGNESDASGRGMGDCEETLETKRAALRKLVNGLSTEPTLSQPIAVDADRRIFRIDLRDYDWDRPVSVAGRDYPDAWEALIAADPYALPFTGDAADDLVSDALSELPVLLVDPFLSAATSASVYSGVLALPSRLDQLLSDTLGIPPGELPSVEAGFIEGTELLAQRWDLGARSGYVWSIADYGRAPGALFADPLQEPLGERELVFTLPNGMNAFAFASADGLLRESWSVTRDSRELDGVARAPRSGWRRHSRALAIRDQVRDYVEANAQLYSDASLASIRQRFPGSLELSSLLESEADALERRALQQADLAPAARDPITLMTEQFERPVDAAAAAALLLVTREELLDNLNLLDPALAALDGGTVPRSVFTQSFADAECVLASVLENQPSNCP